MLKLTEYPKIRQTDRDVEIPNLLEFLNYYKGRYESVLDVGARFTFDYYAREVRKLAKIYHGLDYVGDPKVEGIVDKYIRANAVTYDFEPYDMIICCSTLEHIGMYPIVYSDYKEKRLEVFEKIIRNARKYFWISVPVGQDYLCPGELAIFNELDYARMEMLLKPYVWDAGFSWSYGPQAGYPWKPSDKKTCFRTEYNEKIGTQANLIIEGVV